LIFKDLSLYNFGIFSGKNYISFFVNKDDNNIVLIGGLNGRGKTTIFEAILLALYGKRSPAFLENNMSYSAYLKKYTNNNSKSTSAYVELSFKIPNGRQLETISVKRAWSNNNKVVKDNLSVSRNALYDEYLSENWDTFIEELLPVGLSSLFFFDGEKISRIAEEDETSETTQTAIKSLLGFDIIDRLNSDLRKLVQNKHKTTSNPEIDNNIADCEKEYNELSNKLAIAKQNIASLETKQERLENNVREKEQLFLKKGGSLKETRDSLKEKKENTNQELIHKKTSLVNHASTELPLMLNISLLKQVSEKAEEEAISKNLSANLNYINEYNKRIIKLMEEIDIKDSDKQRIKNLLNKEEAFLEKQLSKNVCFKLSNNATTLINSLLSYNENAENKANIKFEIEETKKLELQLEQLDNYLLLNTEGFEVEGILKDIRKYAKELASIEAELKSLKSELTTLEFKKTELENKLHSLYKEAADMSAAEDDSKRIIKYALLSIDKMNEYKERLINKKIASLSEAITASFHHIIGKKTLISKVYINPQNLSLTLEGQKGVVLKSQLSAGERQILALSIMWGLAQVSGCNLPIIIDTPLGRLDSSHRVNFLTHYLPYSSHQVIVLSTDEEIIGRNLELIDKYIHMKYLLDFNELNNTSKIIEGYFEERAS